MTRISWLLIIPLVLAAVSAPMACVEFQTFTLDPTPGGAGGGSSTSSTSTTSSSTSGMGGMGGGPECMTSTDCFVSECVTSAVCDKGACIFQYKTDGLKTLSQTYGDCNDRVCDGNGGITFNPTDKDPYVWANICYKASCDAAKVPNDNAACKTRWGNTMGKCNNFRCIDCLMDMECTGGAKCNTDNRCVLPQCVDGLKDADESDIDCGGASACPRCAPEHACTLDSDCDIACDMTTLKCVAPSCTDMILNGDETDVDCGGSCAAKCIPTQNCLVPSDCNSGVCQVGICQSPTCDDNVQNQNELGIDCGVFPCSFCPPTP